MKESHAITLLIILSAVVNLCAAFGCTALRMWASFGGVVKFAVIIAVFLLHIAVLVRVRKWFYREYALSAPKFVLFGAVPSVLLSFAGSAVIDIMVSFGAFGPPPEGMYDFRGLNEFAFALFITFYAVSVLIGISVTLGISCYLDDDL